MQYKLFMDLKREWDLFQRREGSPQHDYKELLEVSLKLLGSELPAGVHLEEGQGRQQGPLYGLVTLLCESFCLLQSNGILQ